MRNTRKTDSLRRGIACLLLAVWRRASAACALSWMHRARAPLAATLLNRMSSARLTLACGLLLGFASMLRPQSTQGLLAGRVSGAVDGSPVSGAVVSYRAAATGASGSTTTSKAGLFALPSLSPDTYQLRVAAPGFQPQEVFGLELNVAGRLEADFRLRPQADVFGEKQGLSMGETGVVLRFFGPDVDLGRTQTVAALHTTRGAMESSVSEVIHAREIRDLPLAGRDVYTMLVTQAGVAADSTTARGLGLSVNGQRPSSSNFLLDGVENNNYLITGPLTAIAPEAVQEYRFSSNNFSAEYGGTAGFIANAATRAGGPAWHGTAYFYGKHSAFNANSFQQNLRGVVKPPVRERQPGYQIGGPIRRERLFVSSALEVFRSHGFTEVVDTLLPGAVVKEFTQAAGPTRRLLDAFPAPVSALPSSPGAAGGLTVAARFQPPSTVNRTLALERIDWLSRGGAHRVVGRVSIQRLGRPDFIWSPYAEFVSGLRQNTIGLMVGVDSNLRPNITSEARAAWSNDTLEWDRAHPEIPTLASSDGVTLPGSPAFYAYRNRTRSWELRETMTWIRASHILKFGGSALPRSIAGLQSAGRDGLYFFNTVIDWALDEPQLFSAALDRAATPLYRVPDSARSYRQKQFAGFVQDTWRVAPRVVLNFGARYESYGAPSSTGAVKDFTVTPGQGASFGGRLAAARLTAPPSTGDASVYPADRNDWAGRFGFSYSPGWGPVLRGAYGIFYDRLFDNAWQNVRGNSFQLGLFQLPPSSRNYLEPVNETLGKLVGSAFSSGFPSATLLQPGLRTAYAHSYFLGLQQRLSERWNVELNGAGSGGRKLITTDIVNRQVRLTAPRTISYRGNQGLSNYHSLTAVARYQPSRGLLHVAYTWAHSIDLQSEPLAGDFFDLSFARVTSATRSNGIAAFSRELDSSGDRGNSDFDQRHNLVLYSVWDLPGRSLPLRNWKVAQMGAFRTGFPFTVYAPSTLGPNGDFLVNVRADLVDPVRGVLDGSAPAPGGRRWLLPAAFQAPANGQQGNTGRNAFRGPGLFSLDLSLTRTFSLPRLGETGRISVRADAFNFLNHANLNNPAALVGSPNFGLASFGRTGRDSGFPATVPFTETARQFQFLLRVEF